MDLSRRGKIMGILNVTPDSFSDGGRHTGTAAAMEHARQMIAEGAEIIDIGGESTRPGATEVDAAEEIARTAPVIAAVAAAALEAGADVVNDVSGLRADPAMPALCAARGCGVVVMHMLGDPRTMQKSPHYADVVAEVRDFFRERLATLSAVGIDPEALCFDPGIGFGKTLDHNLALLRDLGSLAPPDRPLLLGVSRKSFIGKVLGSSELADRAWPTVAITAWTREAGALIHRVHEVKPNHEALRMTEAILHGV
jgi:dihydropteroate synthase